ncbi:hypothetical protein ACIG0C_06420 [Kitasatospora aureofaciens]|uniref:Gram-positive cocci surface proteins LPxTG domain-containing protein n=3 Tax=Kitasatospora aureofaciens TaxID=1894 RepID=A0A1E7N6J4_KITAU|nr:hypothetical protein [Kitasatospora aureofaciens]ARF82383.1 hypothetical protein B6264_29045 [Kitasatospora aureofaciens]OEV36327.1 hypothetical protein HS99_0029615 [Kitasatospora aureofaciens]GGU70530.1 hypothetical protein GCM10010502_22560 [Kitasatospora aureofaciens]
MRIRTRPLLAPLVLAAAAVLPAAAPAAAHGDTVHLDVDGQQNGRVRAVATWENDHDPVTEDFAGTLSATAADGRTIGPWRLVPVPGQPGTYTTRELLPAGHWKVAVDCAFPSLGHGERELDVEAVAISDPAPMGATVTSAPPATPGAASAARTTTAAAAAPAAPAAPAHDAPVRETTDDATTWAAIATATAAVALVATGFRLRARARRR